MSDALEDTVAGSGFPVISYGVFSLAYSPSFDTLAIFNLVLSVAGSDE